QVDPAPPLSLGGAADPLTLLVPLGATTLASSPVLIAVSKPGSQTITPSAGVVLLTTDQAPMIQVGALTLSGIAPSVNVTLPIAPSVGSITFAADAVTLGLTLP